MFNCRQLLKVHADRRKNGRLRKYHYSKIQNAGDCVARTGVREIGFKFESLPHDPGGITCMNYTNYRQTYQLYIFIPVGRNCIGRFGYGPNLTWAEMSSDLPKHIITAYLSILSLGVNTKLGQQRCPKTCSIGNFSFVHFFFFRLRFILLLSLDSIDLEHYTLKTVDYCCDI